jgi:tetratricopeptide (TPR) repeat protein
MALFDNLRRPAPPADLRAALIDAVDREDWQGLAVLCERHQDEIRASFPAWRQVPEDVRRDPEAQGRYARGLITVAQLFEQSGDGSLIASLMGTQADNPMSAWQRALGTAQSLLEQDQPGEAADLLRATLARVEGLAGTAVVPLLSRTFGMLGVALFRAGDAQGAVEATRQAAKLCEEAGDSEGAAIYTANLQRMDGGSAVTFRDADGRAVPASDLGVAGGKPKYEVAGGDPVPPEATELHERGREAGGRGDLQEAAALFRQAAERAPRWAYPVYDLAYTHLLLKEPARAIEHYRRTLELSPRGFFTAITALHTLEREARGDLPEGIYLAYVTLETIEDRARKAQSAAQLVEKVPAFAPAWKDLALAADDPAERLSAIQKGLAADPDPDTRGMLRIHEALVLHGQGQLGEAARILADLAQDPSATLATEHLAKAALEAIGTT